MFYVPGPERKLVQEGKPGHYEFVDGTAEQYATVVEQTKDGVRQRPTRPTRRCSRPGWPARWPASCCR